jgi:F0F1-type ATP synthase membrane subunit a
VSLIGTIVIGAEDFVAPSPANFDLPGFFGSEVTKPMVQLVLAAIVVFGFFYLAARKRAMVPGKLQFAGEGAYGMVRNSIARDIIGSHDFQRFVPYLVTLFFFIFVNNLFASIPLIQFPTFSRASMAYALAGLSWVVYNWVGVRKHGLLGLFATGGLYLIQHVGGVGYVAGPLAWILAIAISFLELLVQFLQAYVFTLLNAMYISGALADEH